MALEARIAKIEENFARKVTQLEAKRDKLIEAARVEHQNASIEELRNLIIAGDFTNEKIPEHHRNNAATMLQHHTEEQVKESLLVFYPLIQQTETTEVHQPVKLSQKERKRIAKENKKAVASTSIVASTTDIEAGAGGKKSFAAVAAEAIDKPETSAVEPFREVKKKDRSVMKLPAFEPKVVPTTINAVVQTDGFKVEIGSLHYEIKGRLGFDAIAYLSAKYSQRGVRIEELKRALLETDPNKFSRLITNMGEPGLLYGKVMYALLCATLQYLIELGLIHAGDDAIDSSFSIIIEGNHDVSIQYGVDLYAIDDVCDLEKIDTSIRDLLEGRCKYNMNPETLSALKTFIHRWANYCAIDYKFEKEYPL